MAKILEMPKLSPTMEEGVLSAWHKKEGDAVAVDDLLAEVETDKATMEFRSFDAGTLLKILAPAGAQVKLGQAVADHGAAGEDTGARRGSVPPAAGTPHEEPADRPPLTSASGAAPPEAGRAPPSRSASPPLSPETSPPPAQRKPAVETRGTRSTARRSRRTAPAARLATVPEAASESSRPRTCAWWRARRASTFVGRGAPGPEAACSRATSRPCDRARRPSFARRPAGAPRWPRSP